MACAEQARLQAYFDGEVDALTAASIERHLASCGDCRALLAGLTRTREAIRRHLPLERAPEALRTRLRRALEDETPRLAVPSRPRWQPTRPFWLGAGSGVAVTALAAFGLWLALQGLQPDVPTALAGAHLRSLLPSHLLEVESSERHTVRPWFAGRADVSPVVADFRDLGYPLLGGRVDHLLGQRVAALVYRHGAHVINVFIWSAERGRPPREMTRAGYHMVCWRSSDLQYCAVSDAGWQELQGLARLIADQAARDAAPP